MKVPNDFNMFFLGYWDNCTFFDVQLNTLNLIRNKDHVFLPDYRLYKKGAPLIHNREIVDYSDEVLAFGDGSSKGTLSVIDYCGKQGKK